MRIMLDTNVIISALLFPGEKMQKMLYEISMRHTLVLSSYIIDELRQVVRRKFPTKEITIDTLLSKMSYEMVYTPENIRPGLFDIRDIQDYPVLYTAILEDIDILITGDKDFLDVEVERPEILTPIEFINRLS